MLRGKLLAAAAGALFVAHAPVHAALIGVVQSYPDVSLSGTTLIYDANGVNASTGLLRVVSLGSALNRASGAATPTQSYTSTGDAVADVMMSFAVDNSTGALVANATYNKVSIGFGNLAQASASNFGFSWQGTVTAFGFADNGSAFDARWTLTADQYQAMPAGFGSFVNGALSGLSGGIKISNTANVASSGIWAFDWVRGTFAGTSGNAYAAQIAPFVSGLSTTANRASSTVAVDAWVPLPAAGWMLLAGLGSLLPLLRRPAQPA